MSQFLQYLEEGNRFKGVKYVFCPSQDHIKGNCSFTHVRPVSSSVDTWGPGFAAASEAALDVCVGATQSSPYCHIRGCKTVTVSQSYKSLLISEISPQKYLEEKY